MYSIQYICVQSPHFCTTRTHGWSLVKLPCGERDTHTRKLAAVQHSTFPSRSTLMQLACMHLWIIVSHCRFTSARKYRKSHHDRIWQAKLWQLWQACLFCLFISFRICSSTPSQTSKATLWSRSSLYSNICQGLSVKQPSIRFANCHYKECCAQVCVCVCMLQSCASSVGVKA